MKAFRFRLEKVRQVRETQRRQSQARFIEEQRRLAEQLARLVVRQTERRRAEHLYSGSARGTTRAGKILAARQYLSVVESHVIAQSKAVVAVEQDVESARHDLVERTKDKRILDRLRERRLAEFSFAAQHEKQKQIDDTARQNYFRRHRRNK